MDCKQVLSYIPELLSGELSTELGQEVKKHCASCEQCAQELRSMENLWNTLLAIPDEEPSPEMATSFYAMLDGYQKSMQHSRKRLPWHKTVQEWWAQTQIRPVALRAAAVVVALVIGFTSGRYLGDGPADSGQITELREQMDQMQQTVSLLLMKQSSASQRLLGVNKTVQVTEPDRELLTSLLETVNTDPNVNVRLAAVDALYLYRDRPGVRNALLTSLDRQQPPMVQIALVDLLVAMREHRALQSLKDLMNDQQINEYVRERAEWGIQQLS